MRCRFYFYFYGECLVGGSPACPCAPNVKILSPTQPLFDTPGTWPEEPSPYTTSLSFSFLSPSLCCFHFLSFLLSVLLDSQVTRPREPQDQCILSWFFIHISPPYPLSMLSLVILLSLSFFFLSFLSFFHLFFFFFSFYYFLLVTFC